MTEFVDMIGVTRGAKVVAVLTCFNRRAMTIACLRALEVSAKQAGTDLAVILVDDASTDGTSDAVRVAMPSVEVVTGTGSLFWNKGMHLGFELALSRAADHYLWLNDDTVLLPDALQRLLTQAASLRAASGRAAIVVGATADCESGRVSYGGGVARSRLRRFSYSRVWSEKEPLPCDVMNGNCVLIPREIAIQVGNLDSAYEHAMGDTDYALRARRAGYQVFVGAGIVGHCTNNPIKGTFNDESLPLRTRWKLMMGRKGLPVRSWLRFTRRHGGIFWPVYFSWPYSKLLVSGVCRIGRRCIHRTAS